MDPDPAGWNVRKDGGVFDQFTGATITPRAVVKATARALEYVQSNHRKLFGAETAEEESLSMTSSKLYRDEVDSATRSRAAGVVGEDQQSMVLGGKS